MITSKSPRKVLKLAYDLAREALPDYASRFVADAGYNSEANLRIAQQDMGVQVVIPPRSGRPTHKPPSEPLRRAMHARFARARKLDQALYGQRWQAETVNSMMKRNLGSALRSRTTEHRRHELLLRVLTHNIMLLAEG